jgi:hypothetical protein
MIRQADRDNYREVEDEWRWEFVFYVLSNMGIPDEELEECLPEDGNYLEIEPKHKIALRKYMKKRDVTIVDDHDGGLKIYVYIGELEEHIMVAQWKKCKFVYKEDLKEIDPNRRVYVEVHADVWTSFGENDE